ncbi:hypothetical protein [Brevibacillus porteri]|uniref:hypothetical protein n=1 Tax=Brevibacillus porteri TaxID=2126350 RepID=UPI001FC9E2D4|nr:hypothetical protein [Brevibacillus porteri]MED1802266.1 hypothetical protein [Brevibacillus porteri]MED2129987.1 hypothetical protein [Brevibacillus porteri]MED2745731.1 hypothetical protein [Brevibacillus porteri]MED2816615.1 hypothetical protein [Brevibacillus porteri]MED2897382.1 hypothetical protein [Brevibacillus porteri]
MATGDLIKLGTLYLGGTKRERPTRPWDIYVTPSGAPGRGNIPMYSNQSIEIRDTDSDDAYKIQWREVNDNGKRLLISDRVILWGIAWDVLNSLVLASGKNITIDGQQYILRLLTGGTSRRGSDNYAGGSPVSNEWDRIIVNEAGISGLPVPTSSDLDNTQNSSDLNGTHNQYWNWFYAHTWGQDATAAGRVIRGYYSARFLNDTAKSSQAMGGWRPVLEALNTSPTLKLTSPPENLLGADGNCEDTSKWTKSSVYISLTLESNNKKYGNNGIRYSISGYGSKATGGFWSRDLLTLVDKSQYYVALVDVKNGNADSAFCKVSFKADGSVYKDGNRLTDSTQFNTSHVKISPTDLATANANALTVWGVVTADEGEYAYFDGFRIYQVSQDTYNKIDVDPEYTGERLGQKFPFTDPTINQTLSEGNTMTIQGSVTDTDANDPVTIYLQINNGTILAVDSNVSDGATAIPFAKTLTYKNKRVYSGTTDLVGADLAENTDHTLKVWAEDNKQGKSTEVIRKFRIIWNRPPVIDGENKDLGSFMQPPTVKYSATDPEGNNFTFSEYLNGKQIRSFQGVAGQQYTVEISHDAWIRLDLDVQHQIKIVATDSAGISSERIFTFTRKETHIEFMLEYGNPDIKADFTLDGMPLRVLVTLERYLPEGSSIESVKVCNNYLDAVPTWEDCTGAVKGNRGYLFTNKTKTAANWAINLWVILAKGTATERVRMSGYGGAFD